MSCASYFISDAEIDHWAGGVAFWPFPSEGKSCELAYIQMSKLLSGFYTR